MKPIDAAKSIDGCSKEILSPSGGAKVYNAESLDRAFAVFDSVYGGSEREAAGIAARNRIQDTIRRAADAQCGEF